MKVYNTDGELIVDNSDILSDLEKLEKEIIKLNDSTRKLLYLTAKIEKHEDDSSETDIDHLELESELQDLVAETDG